ncbi:MAG: hypothetical protein CVV18_09025 [Gammaproteobacteria bacterium HGW-Gammaproteobacteria-8]|nr:MAG: hypothetical protein CVV18_09025 [Gammaproteobacteria bacterium HGW-Gammaproteobacteria-8]
MQLSEHRPDSYHFIHSLSDRAIRIVDADWSESLLLTPDQGVRPWPVNHIEAIDEAALAPIFDYAPDVLLLATGRRMCMPDWSLQRQLLQRSIGVEAMSLDAAARTYNILAGENRRVMAALIWEPEI